MFGPPSATHLKDMAELRRVHDNRVTELLKANNRELERRRAAEARVRELEVEIEQFYEDQAGADI